MKKLLFCLVFIGGVSTVFCDNIEKVLADNAKNLFNEEVQTISVDKLKSIKGLNVVLFKNKQGQVFPIYASDDGKSFLAFSNYYYFNDKEDDEILSKVLKNIEDINKQSTVKQAEELFDSFPKEAFVFIESEKKTDNLLTIVTDPDCPYCRNELKDIKNRLKNANVRMILAPVHDEKAFIKSALILKETKNLKSKDADKIIAIFEKYYQDMDVSDKKIDTNFVHDNANKIFKSGFIRGVPYIHEGKLK
ncbi:MAG: hypothetical protein LBD84_01605 [Campylobacteraceae bacterium]|jgi:thiol:disulfide interchange protein DsbC|nr:hypothetical protein [Campylobacteraceae bacterium]